MERIDGISLLVVETALKYHSSMISGYGAVGIFMDTVFLLIQILAKPSYLKTTLKSTILFGAVLGNFACIFAITVFISYLEPKMSESLTYYCPGGLAYVYAYGLPVLGTTFFIPDSAFGLLETEPLERVATFLCNYLRPRQIFRLPIYIHQFTV